MRMNLHAVSTLPRDVLAERIPQMNEPAILLGDDLKIISKNASASALFFDLRRGRGIRKFLSPQDEICISEMLSGQVSGIELINGETHYGATVVCGDEYRFIVIRSIAAGIQSGIEVIYGRSSGYDMNLDVPDVLSDSPVNFRQKELHDYILKLHEELKITRNRPCFNASAVMRMFGNEMNRHSPKLRRLLDISVESAGLVVLGSECDFAMILAYISYFYIGASADTRVSICIYENGGNAVVSMSAPTDLSPYEAACINSARNVGDMDSTGYWFHLVKLLAEGNLWDFEVMTEEDGTVFFTLRMPLSDERFDNCVFRDIDPLFLRRIIEFVFS